MNLKQWIKLNSSEFRRLGILHAARSDDSVLLCLARRVELSHDAIQLLLYFNKSGFNAIREFCNNLILQGPGFDFKVVECVTATKLDSTQQAEMKDEMHKMFGQDLLLEYSVDPEIIGGSLFKVGYVSFDTTYLRYFKQIEKTFRRPN